MCITLSTGFAQEAILQTIEKMTPLAEEVIAKEPDVKKAIARCLCLAVGAVGKMKPRSILTSQEG